MDDKCLWEVGRGGQMACPGSCRGSDRRRVRSVVAEIESVMVFERKNGGGRAHNAVVEEGAANAIVNERANQKAQP